MKLTIITTLLFASIAVAGIIGWVKCLIKLTECDFEPSYKAEVIYTVGTFSGLGAIIGYLDLGK